MILRCLFCLLLTLFSAQQLVWAESMPSIEKSEAFQRYSRRPTTELSKLIFLIDRYKNSELKVMYDGHEYTAVESAGYAKTFLSKNYKKGAADYWVKNHCYRTEPAGNIIYVKFSDGSKRPLKDILLEDLGRLQKLSVG